MNRILHIHCHDNPKKQLLVDPATGEATVAAMHPADSKADYFAPGFFIIHDKTVLAVIPSPKGPLLLIDKTCYPLTDEAVRIDLGDEEEGRVNTFAVFFHDTEVYATDYQRPYSGYDAFIDPETVDFFYWLADGYRKPQFIRFHTLEGEYDGFEKHLAAMPQPPPDDGESAVPEPEGIDSDIAIDEILSGEPLAPFVYPWPVNLMIAFMAVLWIACLKPAWPYVPAAAALSKGEALLARGEYDPAIEQFHRALAKMPSSRRTKLLLAKGYFTNDDPDDDPLGLDTLSDLVMTGTEWDEIKAVLPEGYEAYFSEKKK